MIGRPSDFSAEAANEICERLAKGESLRAICADGESGWLPSERTVFRWLEAHDDFRQQYAHAREVQAETLVDQIVDIADGRGDQVLADRTIQQDMMDGGVVVRDHNRDRLRIDARKWVAAKLAPKKYGDAVQLKHADADGEKLKLDEVAAVTRLSAMVAQIRGRGDAPDDAG